MLPKHHKYKFIVFCRMIGISSRENKHERETENDHATRQYRHYRRTDRHEQQQRETHTERAVRTMGQT